MTVRLEKELERLKERLVAITDLVEDQVEKAIQSLSQRTPKVAEAVIERDSEIDDMEVDLEEECLKILALYQPVSFDLRYIVSVLKINNDLERIGDLAQNLAERCITVVECGQKEYPIEVEGMAEKVREALRHSIESLMTNNVAMAERVLKEDTEINAIHRKNHEDIRTLIKDNPEDTPFYIQFLSVSRYLERIGDLCTNIAEDVIYLVEGKIVRHSFSKLARKAKA